MLVRNRPMLRLPLELLLLLQQAMPLCLLMLLLRRKLRREQRSFGDLSFGTASS